MSKLMIIVLAMCFAVLCEASDDSERFYRNALEYFSIDIPNPQNLHEAQVALFSFANTIGSIDDLHRYIVERNKEVLVRPIVYQAYPNDETVVSFKFLYLDKCESIRDMTCLFVYRGDQPVLASLSSGMNWHNFEIIECELYEKGFLEETEWGFRELSEEERHERDQKDGSTGRSEGKK